jgi:paraquat-inducible protein B
MSKKANPTIIGVFVLGALILVVAGVLIFGAGNFFSEKRSFVLFFDEDIKGLTVGAPIKFRGVTIGAVTDINLRYDTKDLSVEIPVFVEIQGERFHPKKYLPGTSKISETLRKKENFRQLIQQGLRAQLQSDSLVTGKLLIAVDIFPDEPLRLLGSAPGYEEIPTIPSTMEKLSKTIEDLPLEELVNKTMSAVEGIDKLVNSPDLAGSISALRNALESFDKMAKNIDGQVDPIAESFRNTSKAAQLTIEQIKVALGEMQSLAGKNSPIYYEVNKAFEELTSAARSIEILADYIQRNPEALIRGKK